MMKIEAFAMDRFRNMEEFGFFLEVNGQINKLLTGEMEAKVVNDFQTAMDEYSCALKQRRSSEETAVMKEIDNQIKKLYSGMVLMVQSLMLHPSEEKRTMAEPVTHHRQIWRILQQVHPQQAHQHRPHTERNGKTGRTDITNARPTTMDRSTENCPARIQTHTKKPNKQSRQVQEGMEYN